MKFGLLCVSVVCDGLLLMNMKWVLGCICCSCWKVFIVSVRFFLGVMWLM